MATAVALVALDGPPALAALAPVVLALTRIIATVTQPGKNEAVGPMDEP
jgi:hypothetical protein